MSTKNKLTYATLVPPDTTGMGLEVWDRNGEPLTTRFRIKQFTAVYERDRVMFYPAPEQPVKVIKEGRTATVAWFASMLDEVPVRTLRASFGTDLTFEGDVQLSGPAFALDIRKSDDVGA